MLIAGFDPLLSDGGNMDQNAVILDIKLASAPAVKKAILDADRPWFSTMFQHDGARAITAQREATARRVAARLGVVVPEIETTG